MPVSVTPVSVTPVSLGVSSSSSSLQAAKAVTARAATATLASRLTRICHPFHAARWGTPYLTALSHKRHNLTSGAWQCRLGCQLQPLVDPQLGQAWHDPAGIICTPHCMQIGASAWRMTPAAGVLSSGVGTTVPSTI